MKMVPKPLTLAGGGLCSEASGETASVKGEITKAIVDGDERLSLLSSSPVATRAVIVEERNLLIKKNSNQSFRCSAQRLVLATVRP